MRIILCLKKTNIGTTKQIFLLALQRKMYVDCEITKLKKNYCFAKLIAVVRGADRAPGPGHGGVAGFEIYL